MDICFKKQSKSLHMKALQFTLIFVIIGYFCVYTEEVNCQALFDEKLKGECEQIKTGSSGSCSFFKEKNYHCEETNDCANGNGNDQDKCTIINPSNFKQQKCDLDGSTCKPMNKGCTEWKMNSITEIDCTNLPNPSNNEVCRLVSTYPGITGTAVLPSGTETNGYCRSYHKSCTTINLRDQCIGNIPNDYSTRCDWDDDRDSPKCQAVTIYCDDNSYYKGENVCPKRKISATDATLNERKKCIYKGGVCKSEYKECKDIPDISSEVDCENHMPLNTTNFENYDFSKKCVYDYKVTETGGSTRYICKEETRKCNEYNNPNNNPNPTVISGITIPSGLLDETFCNKLETTEDYQRCAYDDENNKCYEEYKTCEDYTSHKVETNRGGCEGIILTDPNKKCVYDQKEDKCTTKEKYTKCTDYQGKDKKTCESILSSDTHQYCILDKDIECIEKPINCSEAYTEDICIKIAKPTDSNKRCAFKNNKCVEEFIRCEDFLEATSTSSSREYDCEHIKLYDGKKCEWETTNTGTSTISMCRSQFKTCWDATTKEECELIAKTGVTDPERKVCSWTGSSCVEDYKYCSDYRGNIASYCTRIKPYDESGNNIDIGSKCIYEDNERCQRTPVECEDADNAILCETYSVYIKDNDKKYCFFDGSNCKAQYKNCADIETSGGTSLCLNNIIQGFTTRVCTIENNKCVRNYACSEFFTVNTYKSLICKSIHPNCSYTSTNKCEYSGKKCTRISFYSKDTNNKEICENMEASEPYKKCVLKEDQSGCEEVYRVLEYSSANVSYEKPPDASSEGNSSGFIGKGIHLIMAFLCLLI